MSPASGDGLLVMSLLQLSQEGFHSINVPSEWGQKRLSKTNMILMTVSIQLMSPASGDIYTRTLTVIVGGFHSINVPSEWGHS